MKTHSHIKTIALLAVLVLLAVPAHSTCVTSAPQFLHIGESACVQICSGGYIAPITLEGNRNGEAAVPTLILSAGCNLGTTHCNNACTPVAPPTSFVLGGDSWYPDQYFGHSDCVDIYIYYVHDNPGTWAMEVWSNGCNGCFCVTFDGQLPVTLLSGLSATEGNSKVSLNWATASENNNDHFEILRDGHAVGSVPGLGSSPMGRGYSWTDQGLQNGTTYAYSLVAVDASNHRQELGTTEATPRAVEMVSEYALYQNYPNPFNPTTTIGFDVVQANHVVLKVYNPMGAIVATVVNDNFGTGHHAVSFDGHNLTSGLYFYTISIGDRYTATRKMLLVK
jgi:hypothetical protein